MLGVTVVGVILACVARSVRALVRSSILLKSVQVTRSSSGGEKFRRATRGHRARYSVAVDICTNLGWCDLGGWCNNHCRRHAAVLGVLDDVREHSDELTEIVDVIFLEV